MTWRDAGIEGPVEGLGERAVAEQQAIFRNTFVESLGVKILEAKPGYALATLDVGPHFLHPGGFAHGGALASLGDTVAAWATFPALKQGDIHTTIEFKANFLKAVSQGTLRAEAKAAHIGRRTIVLDVRITDERGRLICMMTVTQAVVPLQEARPDQAGDKP
ncbi:MAG: PaaI family thioesterase [Actinomycetota bacterium]|nr:PaaI family thioesterase [Actinomycetota bacterium]